jgi:archaemetzincin
VRAFCAAFFLVPVRILDERPLPDAAFQKDRNQHDVSPLLEVLAKEVEDLELVRAGLADRDLSWVRIVPNFVFGGASLTQRVGVYSVHRFGLGVVPEPLYRRRAFQLLAHEIGHVLGMAHCVYYRCLMQGTNSLAESDSIPLHLCPVCRDKLAWNLGWDVRARQVGLAALFRAEKLDDEAAWAEAALTPR